MEEISQQQQQQQPFSHPPPYHNEITIHILQFTIIMTIIILLFLNL